MNLRPATPADIPAITAIYAHHVRHGLASFELEPPDEAEMARRHADIVGRGYPYLVAESDGLVVGYAYASAYRPRPAYRYAVENSIYVDERQRRRGIGSQLLGRLMAECEARDFRQMIAVIGDSANQASIRLHESFGFEHAGTARSVGFKFGRWVDSVTMQRALGQGDGTLP